MDPNKVDLEIPFQYYIKLKERVNLTPGEVTKLIKYVDEVKFIMHHGKLGKQGKKSAEYIYGKLSQLEKKHRIKKEIQINQGLFQN